MKYKKGDTITIKTHEEMIADPDIKCWFDGDQRKPSHTRTYSYENSFWTLTNALAKQVLGKEYKVLSVKTMGYELQVISFVKDWMLKDV